MSDIKPMQLGRVKPLLASESVDPSISSEDYDWDGGGYAGEASVNDQWKQPCRAATTASITIATALNSGDTLDGVTLATGDRVLVKDQGTASQNGIYIVGTTPERAPDMDDDDEVLGAVVYVIDGTTNAGTVWTCINTTATVVDTDDIDWAQLTATVAALDDVGDVNAPAPSDGDVLTWDSTPGEWVAAAPTGGGSVATDTIWDTKGDLAVGTGADTASKLAAGTDGYGLVARSGEATGLKWEARTVAIAFVIDGAGSAITTGAKGFLKVPFACTITESEIESDTSTTTTLTIKKRAYGGGAASSIVAAALPTLTAATEAKDSTLTGWTTSVSAGDKLYWEVTSNNNATRLTSTLTATRT